MIKKIRPSFSQKFETVIFECLFLSRRRADF